MKAITPRLMPVPPPVRALGRADTLRPVLRRIEDDALDIVGGFGSSVLHYRNVRVADRNCDAYADRIEARAVSIGDPILLADIREWKRWEKIEDGCIVLIWRAFKQAADGARRIVLVLGRRLGGGR